MNFNGLFIDSVILPSPFSAEETYQLLEKVKHGDIKAKEMLIIHNIKLVLYEVGNKFQFIEHDKEDLVSIGIIGLMKAVDTFDIDKKLKFSTYAAKCIDNEILSSLRSLKKTKNLVSLEKIIAMGKRDDDLKLIDILTSDIEVEDYYLTKEENKIIHEIIEKLPIREREIIKMYFRFYDNKKYTYKEIAKKFGITSAYVGILIKKVLNILEKELQQNHVISNSNKIKIR